MESNKKTIYVLGIIVTLAAAALLFYWVKGVVPQRSVVESQAAEVKPVNRNILSSAMVKKIQDWQRHGNVPINLSKDELSKPNPFE